MFRQSLTGRTMSTSPSLRNLMCATPFWQVLSFGANVTRFSDNTTIIQWDKVTSIDLRFYDQGREQLLYLFGNFWIVIAIVLLLPYLMTMRKKE